MNNIPWKEHAISIKRSYGRNINATIFWWEKDYFIEVYNPVRIKLHRAHIMHMVPVKYVLVLEGESSFGGYEHIPILEDCKSRLIRHFETAAI